MATTAAALAALAACAPPANEAPAPPQNESGAPDSGQPDGDQPPNSNPPDMEPDLAWVEPDFGWTAVTDSNLPPVRLIFGEAATDHVMTTITCGESPGMLDFAYFEEAPDSDGMRTDMVVTSADAALSETITAEAECPYSQLHDSCVTTATTDRTETLNDLLTASQPIRFTVAGEEKWFPAPGAAGQDFLAACQGAG